MNFETAVYPWQTSHWQYLLQRHQKKALPHALLFSGPKGMGKLELAKLFARLILEHPFNQEINLHPDFIFVQPEEDKESIKIDQIRALISQLQKTPQNGHYQLALIEPAEAMTLSSANALLKTLEEPSLHTLLVLVSHSPHLLPITIRSRCQNIIFNPYQHSADIKSWSHEHLKNFAGINTLLNLVEYAPLKALELESDSSFSDQLKLIEALLLLIARKAEPIQLASEYEKLFSAKEIVILCQKLLMDFMKVKAQANLDYVYFPEKKEEIRSLVLGMSWDSLFSKQEKLKLFLKDLNANIHLNSLVLIENLFLILIKNT